MTAQHRNFSQSVTVGAGATSSDITLVFSGLNNYHEVYEVWVVSGAAATDTITWKYTENNNDLTWDTALTTAYAYSDANPTGGVAILSKHPSVKGLTIRENQKLKFSITNGTSGQKTYVVMASTVQITRD